jgi:hypothetical protein
MLLPPHLRCKQHSFRVIGGEPDFGALVFPLRQIALAHCGVKSIHDPRCPLIPRRKLRHFRLGQRFRSTTRAPGELGHYARALALEDARPSFAAHVGGVHMKSRNRERSSMLQWANRRIGARQTVLSPTCLPVSSISMARCPNFPFRTPMVDLLHFKASVETNLEGRQFIPLHWAKGGGATDAEVIGDLTHCEQTCRSGVAGLHSEPTFSFTLLDSNSIAFSQIKPALGSEKGQRDGIKKFTNTQNHNWGRGVGSMLTGTPDLRAA